MNKLVLKIYGWSSITIVLAPTLIINIVKVAKHGFLRLVYDPSIKDTDKATQVRLSIFVLAILFIYIILWVRANLILMKTDDANRAENILKTLALVSFILVLIDVFPKPDWFRLICDLAILVATIYVFRTFKKVGKFSILNWQEKMTNPSHASLFIGFGIPFGLLEGLRFYNNKLSFNVFGAIFAGAFFGFFMSIAYKRSLNRMGLKTGFSDPSKQQAVFKSIRTGKLPDDPEVLKALPYYVDKRIESSKKNNQRVFLIYPILCILGIVTGFTDKNPVYLVLGVLFFILSIFMYRYLKKYNQRLNDLEEALVESRKS